MKREKKEKITGKKKKIVYESGHEPNAIKQNKQ